MNLITKHGIVIATVVAAMFIVMGCSTLSTDPAPDQGNRPGSTLGLLYVQYAPAGTLVLVGDGDPNHYTLTLNDVLPVTTYFSDRPRRSAGTLSIADFIDLPGLFNNENPPLAAISAVNTSNGLLGSVVFELRNPIYDEILDVLFYDAILIDGPGVHGLTPWDLTSGGALPRNFEQINVFIDNVECIPHVNPQCTD